MLPSPGSADDGAPDPSETWSRARGVSLDALYTRHAAAVFRFAMRCVGRRDLAEDLTSEAFLALQQSLDRIDADQLPSWLFKVVRNRAIDHWRRQETERKYAAAQPPGEPVEAVPTGGLALLQSRALKPVHRVCLLLRYVYGMGRPEIARATGLNEIQVKGHLQYALDLLRRELKEAP
jgi:RNA polymerase sigma-70 factor (ECF subfamily)